MNLITIIISALILLSFIPGIKIAPRGKLNEKAFALEAMTPLKGMMALFVLFHHISQKKLFEQTHTIQMFTFIGFVFVGIFFFCSGYGLYKSFATKENYLENFPKKRIFPIVISYYVMIAIYAVYYLIVGNDFTPVQWGLKLTGLILINSQSWFIYVIVIMYFAFYLIYKNEKLRKHGVTLLLIVALVQGALFIANGHFPWWLGPKDWWKNGGLMNCDWWKRPVALLFEGEWWVNSTIAFAFGVFIAEREKTFVEWIKKNYFVKLLISILLCAAATYGGLMALWHIGYWTEFGGDLGLWRKGVTYLIQGVQILASCFFVIVLMQKVYVSNRFYNFLGKRSLEIYLIQEMFLFSWAFLIEKGFGPSATPVYKSGNWNALIYAVCVFVTVTAAATIYNFINVSLTKKLKGKK